MDGQLAVVPIESRQPAPACHFTVRCSIDGFEVAIEGEGRADDLRAIVDKLKTIGATPAGKTDKASDSTASEDAPVCEFHGKMRRGNHGWFCPKKMGDGSFCKSKA